MSSRIVLTSLPHPELRPKIADAQIWSLDQYRSPELINGTSFFASHISRNIQATNRNTPRLCWKSSKTPKRFCTVIILDKMDNNYKPGSCNLVCWLFQVSCLGTRRTSFGKHFRALEQLFLQLQYQ